MSEEVRPLGLADAIDAVRRELQDAQERGRGESVQFRLGSIDLELRVEMATAVRGEGGIQVWVVSAKGGGERTSTTSHIVRVQLTPVTAVGGDVRVSDHGQAGQSTAPDSASLGGNVE